MLQSTKKLRSPEKFLDTLEIVEESCSEQKMNVENETSCIRIILLFSSIFSLILAVRQDVFRVVV